MASPGCAGCKAGVVVEGLVMELKNLVRAVRPSRIREGVGIRASRGAVSPAGRADIAVGIRPSTRVPCPPDAGGTQLITDRRAGLRRQVGGAWTGALVGGVD